MKALILLLTCSLFFSGFSQTVITKNGTITADETWTADTIKVNGDISIENNVTLTITPGTYIEFQGMYKLILKGRLVAEGEVTNYITFTAKDTVLTKTSGGWGGINIENTDHTDTSIIAFCNIHYGNNRAIYGQNLINGSNKLKIINNTISKNSNTEANVGKAAIYFYNCSKILIENNLITDNESDGISYQHSYNPVIINNTVADNTKTAINISNTTNPTIINNIFWTNAGSIIYSLDEHPRILNNVFKGLSTNINGNISDDPQFMLSGEHPYELKGSSPCINAGKANFTTDSLYYSIDHKNEARIKFSAIDMGAYEYHSPMLFIDDKTIEVYENINSNKFLGSVNAYYFESGNISYNLLNGSQNHAITFDAATQNFYSKDTSFFNHEVNDTLKFKIEAIAGAYKDTMDLNIVVNNLNEALILDSIVIFFDENPNNQAIIDTAIVYHEDKNEKLTFKIFNANGFAINDSTGVIYVEDSSAFDYEKSIAYYNTMQVSDGMYTSTSYIHIKLNNINEPCSITSDTLTIDENKTGWVHRIISNDTDKDTLSFKIIDGNINNAFTIDSAISYIIVNNRHAIDYETTPVFNLTVTATDGEFTDTAIIQINLTDLDEKPRLEGNYLYVNENNDAGISLDTMVVYYYGIDTLHYSIISGNLNNTFAIGDTSGILSVEKPVDYELVEKFTLEIVANDGTFSDTATYTIIINDIPEKGLTPFPGLARTNAVSFSLKNIPYIGLGFNADSVLGDFWKYNTTDSVWQRIARYPGKARKGAVSFVLNNYAVVGLGSISEGFNTTFFNDFYYYDIPMNTWYKIADFPGEPRQDAVAFVIGDTAYVGTGKTANGSAKDWYKYSLESDTWTEITGFTGSERAAAVAFTLNNKGYVSGGVDISNSGTTVLSDVQEYDPETGIWTERIFADGNNLSYSDAVAISAGNKAFICYGNKSKVVSYNPATNKVKDLGDILGLGNNRFNPISFILGDSIYFGLGSYSEGLWETTYPNDIVTLSLPISYSPSEINISKNYFDENAPEGSFMALLTATDKNTDDVHTFEFVGGSGDLNNSEFTIKNDSVFAPNANYENKGLYSVRIRATDLEGNYFEDSVAIFVRDVNDAPTTVRLGTNTFPENNEIGNTEIFGNLGVDDEDFGDIHTYTFVDGDNDNNNFTIDSNLIYPAIVFNYEEKQNFKIEVMASDSSGASVKADFEIFIQDMNDAPYGLALSNNTIAKNAEIETIVGYLTTHDEDVLDNHIFVLNQNSTDAEYYSVSDSTLRLAKTITGNNEVHEISIIAKDNFTEFEQAFSIIIEESNAIYLAKNASEVFSIYPNPSKGTVHIQQLKNDVQISQIKVLNTNGSLVKTFNANQLISQLNISEFKSGIYFFIIETNKGFFYHKIILE